MTTAHTGVSATSQNVTLPHIPELFNPNFLDVLLPPSDFEMVVDPRVEPPVSNPMMDALLSTTNLTRTWNSAPAYKSTGSALLDTFQKLGSEGRLDRGQVDRLLSDAWEENPELTLRIIWNLRSIHDGKGDKETFYVAFAWLYENHPRTAISNLSQLIDPVCTHQARKGDPGRPHGYWKDLLNILSITALDDTHSHSSWFLHRPRPLDRDFVQPWFGDWDRKTRPVRPIIARRGYENLVVKLQEPKFKALFVAVARLFAEALIKDAILAKDDVDALSSGSKSVSKINRELSLAAKWAPTPGASHDRFTNITTAIVSILHHQRARLQVLFPSALESFDVQSQPLDVDSAMILRSYFQRWFLTPLRALTHCTEPLMSANEWSKIKYSLVPSICMKINSTRFAIHDEERFEHYLIDVEKGKRKISGATLIPHEILLDIVSSPSFDYADPRNIHARVKAKLAETQVRVAEAQWKTLIENLRKSGSIENSIAVCDVSGSMGSFYGAEPRSRHPRPIAPAIALSLVLASLAKPPFNAGFITFSQQPEFVKLDLEKDSLAQTVQEMSNSSWGMNTNLNAVFTKLLLPLAIRNKLKKEDMIKRLFIFSDMQFDDAQTRSSASWETNYDAIEQEYRKAGYDVPEIVYWDLAGGQTVEVLADRKGVAMMSGFSPAMLKVFMGEQDEEEEAEMVDIAGDDVVEVKKAQSTPYEVMVKALKRASYDKLVVVD